MTDRRIEKDRREADRRTKYSLLTIDKQYHNAPYIIDYRKKCILLSNEPVKLSPKEFQLLQFFIRNRGTVFSSEELLANLWPPMTPVESEAIKQYVYILRQKIEIDPRNPQRLITLNGFGYRLQ